MDPLPLTSSALAPPSSDAPAFPVRLAGVAMTSTLLLGGSLHALIFSAAPAFAGVLGAGGLVVGASAYFFRAWLSRRGPEPAPIPSWQGPSLATLALVAQNTTSGVVITDALGRIEWVNSAFTQVAGYTVAEALGQHPGRLLQGPETNPATVAELREAIRNAVSVEAELINYHKDGRTYWVQLKIDPVFDHTGRLQNFIAVTIDVTQRRRQEVLNENVLAHAAHAIVSTDANGLIETFTAGAEKLTGYSAAEMIGRTTPAVLHDPREIADRAAELSSECGRTIVPGFDVVVRKARESGQSYEREWTYVRRNGSQVPVRLAVSAMHDRQGRLTGYLSIASEMTEQKQAEERRREFDLRLRKIASQVPGMVFQFKRGADGHASYPYASEGIREIYRLSPSDVVDDASVAINAVHPADRERVLDSLRISAQTLEQWHCEYRTLFADGTERWLMGNALPEPQSDGAVMWHGMITDITAHKVAEQAHEANRAFLQSIYSSVDLAIFVVEPHGTSDFHYVEVNPGFERITGIISDQICGKSPADLVPVVPSDVAVALRANFRRCAEADRPIEYEEKITYNGRTMWWLTKLTPLAHADGRVSRIIGRALNITERKNIELHAQSLFERLQLATGAAQIGIWDFDVNRQKFAWDERLHKLYGTTHEQFDGSQTAWQQRIHPDDQKRIDQLFQAALLGKQSFNTSFRVLRDSGEVRILRALAHLEQGPDGKARRMVGVNWDITTEQRAQDETLRAKNEAEQLNRLLADSLGRAKELAREAEAAVVAKSAFLANMSHEIRTPLNAVLGMSNLLMSAGLTAEQRELAETIRSSGDSLLGLLNDILDFSKIDAGHLELERQPFVMRECIESALDVLAGRTAEKKLDLLYWMGEDVPPGAVGDVTRLRQVIVNLLGNAVKFTDAGEIFLSVRRIGAISEGGMRLHFAVHDSGIGIPRERMDRLFKSFSQVDASTTRHYGGTGLGLAICKRIVELMGGRIWVESEPGKGSTFQFEVELGYTAIENSRPVAAPNAMQGRRLLVVDDNATQCRVLCLQAVTWGMVPRSTTSAQEALSWIERGDVFDLALIDQQMPDMKGSDLVAAIRRKVAPERLPIVLLTPLGYTRATMDLGAVASIAKPLKPVVLQSVALDALQGRTNVRYSDGQASDDNIARVHPLRILLVEDNPVNQRVATLMLKKLGYIADVAGNGLEGVKAIEQQHYDVVLMDIQMPEMDGLQAAREICRRWPAGARPRIVAMTANAAKSDRDESLAAGMDGFISKPVRLQQLSEVLLASPPREAASTEQLQLAK